MVCVVGGDVRKGVFGLVNVGQDVWKRKINGEAC